MHQGMTLALDHYTREFITPMVALLISRCQSDLYSGPTYLDRDGNPVSCFDEYDHAFDFNRACGILNDALDRRLPGGVYYETWSDDIMPSLPDPWEDPETGEVIEPCYDEIMYIDVIELKKFICGATLASYL